MYNKGKRKKGGITIRIKFVSNILTPIYSDPAQNRPARNVIDIALERLKPFPDNPFKPYTEQRLEDLIRSIREDGVLVPIIVRQINGADGEDGKDYEILAGHNRVNAAREAGRKTIPATVCEAQDEEAWRIVVESNFNQRSVRDMKPSELANSLHRLNEAMKKRPGYRSDLQEPEDGSQADNRLRTMLVIGSRYGLSQATIARYIRIAQLTEGLQECLDNRLIGLGVAERLSYLRESEQDIIQRLLERNVKIGTQQAQALKEQSSDHALNEDEINQIITPKAPAPRRKAVKLREDLIAKYFTENQTPEEIEDTIVRALELLRSQAPS